MADTFAYDLVKFLRVIYLKRWFIFKGAVGAGIVAMIVSLVWPETWRANSGVTISTPAYKTNLKIADQQGFDVNWYNSILTSDRLYREILDTFQWLHGSIHTLLDTDAINRLKENLAEKAATLTDYQLIENTNLRVLSELLLSGEEKDDLMYQTRISILGHLSGEGIETIYHEDIDDYEDWTVHDLRQNLSTHIAVLVDTNLEKEFSKTISIAAEAGSAVEAKMLANVWLNLFQARAEQTVRGIFNKEVSLQKQRNQIAEEALNKAEAALADFDKQNAIERIRAEIEAKHILLYGVTQKTQRSTISEEAFDVADETKPFVNQKTIATETTLFSPTAKYDEALIPQKNALEQDITRLQQGEGNAEELQLHQRELNAVNQQIQKVAASINTLNQTLVEKENERSALVRNVAQAKQQWEEIQPLWREAMMLDSGGFDEQLSDASIGRAIKPDKRVFPRRSLMTVLGGLLGLILFTGLAFFQDIWAEVTRPVEDETNAELES